MSRARTRLIVWLVTLLVSSHRLLTAQAPGQGNNAQTPGSVAGRVIDSSTGNGVSGASVSLYPRATGARGARPATTTSMDDGSFRFEQVDPGSYVVFCADPNHAVTANQQAPLTVNAGEQVSDLAIQMIPLGGVQGKVLNDTGKGIAGITVELFNTLNQQGEPQLHRMEATTSGEGGAYLFSKVRPGRYYLAAGGPATTRHRRHSKSNSAETSKPAPPRRTPEGVELNYVRTFYPHATNFESATPLEVPPGGSAPNADVQLQRAETFRVSGKVEMIGPEKLRHGAMLSLAPRDTPVFGGTGLIESIQPDQTFVVDKVPSGSYTLWLLGSYATSLGGSRERILAKQDVDVNAGNVENVQLSPLPPVNLIGHVVLSGSSTNSFAQNMRVSLIPSQGKGLGRYIMLPVSKDGTFGAENVDPGQYLVRPVNLPPGSYVKSIAWNQQDVTTGGIDLSEGTGGELEITLRNGAAEVDGSVTGTGGSNGASGLAVLVPESIPPDGSGSLMTGIKPDGSFAIPNVPPGHYYAYAVEHLTSIWRNVNFLNMMQRNGKSVDVTENGHAQLQVPLLTVDELQADASALGLSLQ